MTKILVFIGKLLASLVILLVGSAIFVVAQQIEKPLYSTSSLQTFLEYMAFNLPILFIATLIGIIVSLISKKHYWGIGAGLLVSFFLFLGRKDVYILENIGMGISALLVEMSAITAIIMLIFAKKKNEK